VTAADSSENLLRRAHWTGIVDTRPLALFRICLGVVLLQDLWARSGELTSFLTDEGIFPRSAVDSPATWGLFQLTGSLAAVTALFAAGALATVAFTLGLGTRLATALTWLFLVSLHHRFEPIRTGGDSLADILLFFGIFTELGGRFSMDALRRGPISQVRAPAFRAMQYLPALLYLYTAVLKLRLGGMAWFNGPIIYQHLHLHGWVRPLGVWLRESPALCGLLATSTILFELALPVLLLVPRGRARAVALLCHLGIQIGILLTLKVGMFTNMMFAITPLWLWPAWLDALGGRFAPLESRRVVARWSRPRIAVAAALAALFAIIAAGPVVGRRMPRHVRDLMAGAGLELHAGLFTHASPSKRWEAVGQLDDGTQVDPLPVALPGARFGTQFMNSLWMQLPYRDFDLAPMGRLVCACYGRARTDQGGPALRSWTLSRFTQSPVVPGQPPPPEERAELLRQDCR
jgi:hypothetical protein